MAKFTNGKTNKCKNVGHIFGPEAIHLKRRLRILLVVKKGSQGRAPWSKSGLRDLSQSVEGSLLSEV